MPSGDQIVSTSWDKTIKVWEVSTGYLLKTFEGHEGYIYNLDINSTGTRMVTCSKTQEIIYWDTNLKSDRSILTVFEEEHENVIEVVVFIPPNTAKSIIKARMEQDVDNNEDVPNGDAHNDEEEKKEEEEEKEAPKKTEIDPVTKRKEELKRARERLAKLKNDVGTKRKKDETGDKEEEEKDDIVVKDEFVASGSRDKRIKIWNAKRGT